MKTIALVALALLASLAAAQDVECPDPSKCPVTIPADRMRWEKLFPDLGPGGPEMATLHVDPETRATTLMIRAIEETHVPWHWHSGTERIAVVAGTLTIECDGKTAELPAGSFNLFPARTIHRVWLTEGGMLFIASDREWDIHWVEGPPQTTGGPEPGPAARTDMSPTEPRFDGVRIDEVTVARIGPEGPERRATRSTDRTVVAELLRALEPGEAGTARGEARWLVTLRARGGTYAVLGVSERGGWTFGDRARGVSATLPRILERILTEGEPAERLR